MYQVEIKYFSPLVGLGGKREGFVPEKSLAVLGNETISSRKGLPPLISCVPGMGNPPMLSSD